MTTNAAEAYLPWLASQVYNKVRADNSKTYHGLFELLHDKEFVWIVPNDDNRLEDALDVRNEYFGSGRGPHLDVGISVLEVVVGLSRRMVFIAGGAAPYWAWDLLDNLGLLRYNDPVGPIKSERIDAILEDLIWRNYEPDGRGGFFPLNDPKEDQTKVELWYQMQAYIDEMYEQRPNYAFE